MLRSGASVQNGIAGGAISNSKSTVRKALRNARRAYHTAEHRSRSTRAASAVIRLPAFKSGARVAVYLPFDRETDTAALLSAARRRGVRIFVPVISDLRHRRMRFLPLSLRRGTRTRRGTFGIRIPQGKGHAVAPRWLNLIVVPLVGIDDGGRRLGMGGGFYDRAFAYRRHRLQWRGPRLVGLAFDCQRTADVHADLWDIRLDCLATESGLRYFTAGQS